MKTRLLFLPLMIICISLMLVSCKKDDTGEVQLPLPEFVPAKTLSKSMLHSDNYGLPSEVKITCSYDGKKLTLPEFNINIDPDQYSDDQVHISIYGKLDNKIMPQEDSIIRLTISNVRLSGVPYKVNFDCAAKGAVTFDDKTSHINLEGRVKGNLMSNYYYIANPKLVDTKTSPVLPRLIDSEIDAVYDVDGRKLELNIKFI